jgi:hypothetical protein
MKDLTPKERALFASLSTPQKIQDFLDRLPINHEKKGETSYSPRMVLVHKKAHCLEGALFAAAALSFHGKPALLMNLRTSPKDEDHAVALFRENGRWGALSKTNHPVLRYRDAVYTDLRELAMSYFHEYYLDATGRKTLRAYAGPFRLERLPDAWMTSEKPLWKIAHALRDSRHFSLLSPAAVRSLRKATPFERKASRAVQWP